MVLLFEDFRNVGISLVLRNLYEGYTLDPTLISKIQFFGADVWKRRVLVDA